MTNRSHLHLRHLNNSIAISTNEELTNLNTSISTLNNHNDQVETKLQDVADKIGVDSSDSPLSLTSLVRVQKDLIDNKLSQISSFLDKDNSQFHLKHHPEDHHLMIAGNTSADGSGTKNHAHVDGNGILKVNQVSSQNVQPSNTADADHASHSQSLAVGLRCRTDINDNSTGKFLQCNTSGQLNCNVVNSVNTEIHGHTDISDTNTSVRIKADSLGSMIVEEAPPIYASATTLGNTNRLDNSNSSGLSDSIDMEGFRSISFTIKYTADSGQDFSSPLKFIYVFGSFDNSEFFNTGSSLQLAEHNISGSSGTYRAFGFVSNFGARYLRLGGNVAGTNFSACEVKFVRFNGGF